MLLGQSLHCTSSLECQAAKAAMYECVQCVCVCLSVHMCVCVDGKMDAPKYMYLLAFTCTILELYFSLSLFSVCVRACGFLLLFFLCICIFFFMSVGLMTKSVFGILSNCGIAFINRIEKAL